jgi:hypothetical protein
MEEKDKKNDIILPTVDDKNVNAFDYIEASKKHYQESNNEDHKKRTTAVVWWNSLGNKEKDKLCVSKFPDRNYITLTGREVQIIYEAKESRIAEKTYTREEVIDLEEEYRKYHIDYHLTFKEWFDLNYPSK